MAEEDVSEFVKLLRGAAQVVDGAAQVVDGLSTAASAVGPVLDKVDGVVNHLTAPATLERVAGAAAEAAVGAVVAEARVGAERPPTRPESTAEPTAGPATVRCSKHGVRPWHGTICCSVCGRVFQTHYEQYPLYAPEVCPCGARLALGLASVGPVCAGLLCTDCFVSIARSGGRAVRAQQSGAAS